MPPVKDDDSSKPHSESKAQIRSEETLYLKAEVWSRIKRVRELEKV